MKALNLAASLVFLISSSTSAATLAGDTIDAYVGGFYGLTRVNGFGLDRPFVVKDGKTDTKQYSNVFTLDVDGDGFGINFYLYSQLTDGFTLNLTGLDFAASAPVTLSGLDVSTNLAGVTYGVGPDSIKLQLGNVMTDNGMYFKAKFITTPVPELGTSTLLAVGLIALTSVRLTRRHRR